MPFVRGPETQIASKRSLGATMDPQRSARTVLAEAIYLHVGILKRSYRSNGQVADMEVVPAADKGTKLRTIRVPGRQASQGLAARVIGIVAPIDAPLR